MVPDFCIPAITKGTFHICEKGEKEICAPEGALLYLPCDIEYTSYWEQIHNSSYIAFNYNLYDFDHAQLHLDNNIIIAINDKSADIYKLLKHCADIYIQNEEFANIELQSLFL